MDKERRRRRSSSSDQATRYQLQQVIEDFQLDTVVLVDEAGRLVSGVGRDSDFDEVLAKETPRLAAGSHCRLLYARLNQHRPSIRANQISACEFRTAGRRYFMAAVGSMTTMRDVGLYRAILGVRRIIAAA